MTVGSRGRQSSWARGPRKDTVNAALERIARIAAMQRHIQHARDGLYDDLRDPEVMKGAWR